MSRPFQPKDGDRYCVVQFLPRAEAVWDRPYHFGVWDRAWNYYCLRSWSGAVCQREAVRRNRDYLRYGTPRIY